jgi:cell division septum initiation protein DivIVA
MTEEKLKLIDLAEAHVLNVQKEIKRLEASRDDLSGQITQLTNYMTESVAIISAAKAPVESSSTTPTLSF